MSKIGSWTSSIIHVRRIQRTASAAAQAAESVENRVAVLRSELAALRDEVAALRGDVASAHGDFHRLALICEGIRSDFQGLKVTYGGMREHVSDEITRVEGQVDSIRREVLFQQRRLTAFAVAHSAGPQAEKQKEALSGIVDQRLDSLYVALEDVLRGTREDIKERLAPYLERLSLAGAVGTGKPILDIGCGRGEWLELLGERHLDAYGIDSNTVMVELARSLGLDARHADLLQHLHTLGDASVSGITAFHVVEHLPYEVLIDFIDEALRVLMPGGIIILETPNPETMRVGATNFYYDPTHRNPIPPLLLQFLLGHRGFTNLEIVRLHPFPASDRLNGPGRDTAHLNIALFGPQDYAVIGRCDGI